jgi:outer membrane lipoprotein-sorting protein
MMRRTISLAVVLVAGCAMAARAAETLESVEKKIAEQAGKYKTLQYDTHMVSDMSIGEGMSSKSTMDGQVQAMRKAGKVLSRVDSKSRTTMKMGDAPAQTQEVSSLMVNDGQYVYTLTDVGGQKMAHKTKPDPKAAGADPMDTKQTFDAMRKEFNLKILPDQTVDGKDCWVIEATAKDAKAPNTIVARMVMDYDKKTGLPVKSVSYDMAGKVSSTMTISDVKVNPEIPADRFVFKAPPGVEVMDMTKMGGMGSMPAMPPGGEGE